MMDVYWRSVKNNDFKTQNAYLMSMKKSIIEAICEFIQVGAMVEKAIFSLKEKK
jgi:septum formation topological specificity factor MinE